jgi:hypothetical protein
MSAPDENNVQDDIEDETPFEQRLREYRDLLQDLEQKAQEDYDKAILTLSGGALGISFAFCKDIVPLASAIHKTWLAVSWISWAVSLTCALLSLFTSILALGKAVDQVDDETIYSEHPGSISDWATLCFNIMSGVGFIVGVGAMIAYVTLNLHL